MPESGRLGVGVGNVLQIGGYAEEFTPLGGSQIYDGDLVYLQAGKVASIPNGASGSSGFGASFIGVANGATPTYGLYGDKETPNIRVLIGGKAKLTVTSATYKVGDNLYLNAAATAISNSSNGTAIGQVVQPPGTSFGADPYAAATTTVWALLAHPGLSTPSAAA